MKGVLMLCCTRLFYYETFLFTACNPNLKSQLQAESWRKEAGVKSQEHKVEHLDLQGKFQLWGALPNRQSWSAVQFDTWELVCVLEVTLDALFWTEWFLSHFSPAYGTKWLGLNQMLVRVVSAYTSTLEKPGKYSNGHQTTSLLIYTKVSKLIIKGRGRHYEGKR